VTLFLVLRNPLCPYSRDFALPLFDCGGQPLLLTSFLLGREVVAIHLN